MTDGATVCVAALRTFEVEHEASANASFFLTVPMMRACWGTTFEAKV